MPQLYTSYGNKGPVLFNRDWSVQITPRQLGTPDQYGNQILTLVPSLAQLYARQLVGATLQGGKTNPNAIPGYYDNIKIVADFILSTQSQVDGGKLEMWNFNATSRKCFQKGAEVILSAGYVGLMKPIWVADTNSSNAEIERRGPDIVTTFKMGSFQREIEQNIFFKNYSPPNSTLLKMLSDIAKAMGAALYPIQVTDRVYGSRTFIQTCKSALYTLCNENNLEWHITNNKLYILVRGFPYSNNAIVLDSGFNGGTNTGLIGVPSWIEGGKLKFQTLLNPDIIPSQLVQIISENVNGFFTINRAHYKLDSHGHDWHIECEGYPNTAAGNQIQFNSVNPTGITSVA